MGFEVFWGIFGFLGQNRGFYGFSRFLWDFIGFVWRIWRLFMMLLLMMFAITAKCIKKHKNGLTVVLMVLCNFNDLW
jgi:hypothetical protein